jgi:hypothetical protein
MRPFGSGRRTTILGVWPEGNCPSCKTHPLKLVVAYGYVTILFVVFGGWAKHYGGWCSVCDDTWAIEKKKAQERLGGSGIPFLIRFGVLCVLAILGILYAVGLLKLWYIALLVPLVLAVIYHEIRGRW